MTSTLCEEPVQRGPVGASVSTESGIPASTSTSNLPGKITAVFENITISSKFDSGNLARVEECRNSDGPDTREFDLWTSRDCAETEFDNGNKTWFYFSVCTPQNFSDKILKFNIRNLNKQSRLYQQGHTPITKTVPGRGGWERLRSRVDYENVEEGLRISFQITIVDCRRLTTYFAFCYPYSYSECQRRLIKLDDHYGISSQTFSPEAHDKIYYYRELLCQSLEGKRIDLITITSWEGATEEKEPKLPHLFPNDTERCYVFKNKRVIFISSRVHPGESPSSHVFNGLLHFLLQPTDPRAIAARKRFVFKLVPMLNPDGVYRGHYRTDTKGANLNRYYTNPDPALHPSIYAAKSLLLHYHKHQGSLDTLHKKNDMILSSKSCSLYENSEACQSKGPLGNGKLLSNSFSRLSMSEAKSDVHTAISMLATNVTHENTDRASPSEARQAQTKPEEALCDFIKTSQHSGIALYVDLHAHATKRGVFMYGNYFTDTQAAAENMLFPKLMSLNSPHLDFEHCVFSEKNMSTADKRDGMSKEGSGRVAIHRAIGIIPCYTLECNYNSGRQCNPITEATLSDGRASPASSFSPVSHRFNIADFEQVGRALVYSVLDLHQLNPWTRIPNTSFGSLAGIRQSVVQRVTSIRARKMSNGITTGTHIKECGVTPSNSVTVTEKPLTSPFPISVPASSNQRFLGRVGTDVSHVTHLAEVRQQRSAIMRASDHTHANSRSSLRKAEQNRKPSAFQHMHKPTQTKFNMVFPSSTILTVPQGDLHFNPHEKAPGVKATSHASDTTRLVSVRRKPIRSSGGMIPLSRGSANAHRMMGIQTSTNLSRRNCKGAGGHQQNYIPSLEYFTKGSLLKIPEQSSSKVLTGSKLDPILSPDQVVPTSASH